MGRSKRRQGLTAVMAAVLAGLLLVPAGATAFADLGGSAGSDDPVGADAGEALQRTVDKVDGKVEATHDHSSHEHKPVSTENSIAAAAQDAVNDGVDVGPAPTLPTGFADVEAIGDISEATSVAFAPDGTAFIALKTGVIKSFDYDSASEEFEPKVISTTFADLSVQVNNYWDRGLTGIAVDPNFGTAGNNFIYVNYAYNHDPRNAPENDVPRWGDPSSAYDVCPEGQEASVGPPAITGCLATVRITRLTAVPGTDGWVMEAGSEVPLLMGTCQQFGSHASGDVVFGPDGYLYASAGDGASFTVEDWGQANNPCPGDPANGVEGGSLRAQDFQTSGDPLGFGGAVVRMNAVNGNAPDGSTDMAKRMVAYGQRNPWRMVFRPGTSELWSGDVGAGTWEEINRVDVSTVTTPVNRGWPCYEGAFTGSVRQPGWDPLDMAVCENLYAQGPSAVAAPYFSYDTRGDVLTPGEDCLHETSANSGVAFGSSTNNYPGAYRGALFFADFARSCIWMLGKLPNGDPDPAVILPFVQSAETPVDLTTGPGGDLYYVDYGLDEQGVPTENAAGVHRIVYTGTNATPTARITADKTHGVPLPLTINFSGLTSSDPDSDALTYSWDLDGNGTFGDSTSPTPSQTYNVAGNVDVGLRVNDGYGHTGTTTLTVQPGNSPPELGVVTPTSSRTWRVGESISFAGSATDPQQGPDPMPDSSFSWQLSIRHCPSGTCHSHSLQTYSGVSSGSFSAPDHEFPSHLLLTVTVTDSGGLTDSETVQLDPQTVALSFASTPTGATVTVNGADHVTPYTETFIRGSQFNMTAAATTGSGGTTNVFASWSDGGARSHSITAPTTATTYTAAYAPNTAPTVTRVSTYPEGTWYVGQTLGFTAAATDPQQDLTDAAYSFVMERQDCDSGCPRVVVQRWAGVSTERFVVPAMPYPSHLYLTATVTDNHGATGSRTSRIEPRPGSLTVLTRGHKLKVKVDGANRKGGWSGAVVVGSTVRLVAPRAQVRKGVRYVFVRWTDGGARKHDVVVWESPMTVKAVYRRVR